MKKTRLVSMVQYILDIDFMTTTEFCKEYGFPLPGFTGEVKSSADQFLHLDAIKHRLIVEHAKFLNKKLTLAMFVGTNPVFCDFETSSNFENIKVLKRKGENQIYAYLSDEKFSMSFPRDAQKIEDLIDDADIFEYYKK